MLTYLIHFFEELEGHEGSHIMCIYSLPSYMKQGEERVVGVRGRLLGKDGKLSWLLKTGATDQASTYDLP